MKVNYFEGCSTIEDVKHRYYELVRRYHPDKPENGEAEQEILKVVNSEYEMAFKRFKNIHRSAEGETYTKEADETPQQFKDIINKIIRMDGINIEVCGSWIWITGNTRPYKDYLKEQGFRWSPKKEAWHWHTGDYKKWSKQELSLNEIRAKYGSHTVEQEKAKHIANSN